LCMHDLNFKKYLGDRKIAEHSDGFFIIKPDDEAQNTPLFCPHCSFAMRSFEDDCAFKDFQCCDFCSRNWAAPNKEQWILGWRPEKSMVIAQNRLPLVFEVK